MIHFDIEIKVGEKECGIEELAAGGVQLHFYQLRID